MKSVQFAMKENKIRDLHNFKRYCNWFWNDILIGDADLENEHETSILIIDDFFASFLAILEQPTPRRLDASTSRCLHNDGDDILSLSFSRPSAWSTRRTSCNQYGPNGQKACHDGWYRLFLAIKMQSQSICEISPRVTNHDVGGNIISALLNVSL